MKSRERSVVLVILFSLITCGIYFLYWMYATTEDVNAYLGDNDTSGVLVLLFGIITCGIYVLYWYYKMGKRISYCQEKASVRVSDDSIVLLLLSVFGFSIISAAIIQSNLNNIWNVN
ncbi:MAG: DUF4234 domain-containing protein [Clostridiaceae bacterium]|nr:DUF4234 domain-containing protein [Clostridiaceae bacterium]